MLSAWKGPNGPQLRRGSVVGTRSHTRLLSMKPSPSSGELRLLLDRVELKLNEGLGEHVKNLRILDLEKAQLDIGRRKLEGH